jgi:hypothetical protein
MSPGKDKCQLLRNQLVENPVSKTITEESLESDKRIFSKETASHTA